MTRRGERDLFHNVNLARMKRPAAALLIGLVFLACSPFAGSGWAQDLVILRSQMSSDGTGREMSEELADLIRARIPIPVEIEGVPPGRIGEAMSRPGRAVCAIVAKANLDRLSLVPLREVARYVMVIAEFNQRRDDQPPAIGGLNFFINQQVAAALGVTLHIVPSMASAVGMIRAGRLTHLMAADGVVRNLARVNGLNILSLREVFPVSMWMACSQASTELHRAAYAEAWDALLQSGELDDLMARHESSGALIRPPKPSSP